MTWILNNFNRDSCRFQNLNVLKFIFLQSIYFLTTFFLQGLGHMIRSLLTLTKQYIDLTGYK